MIYLSPRSIWLLRSDNQTRYKGYVLWERWSFDFNPYTTVWDYCHRVLEDWAKGKDTKYKHYLDMLAEFKKAGKDTFIDWVDFEQKFEFWLEWFMALDLPKPQVAEQEIKKTIKGIGYWLKAKIDWMRSDHWADYKFVWKLTEKEDAEKKYWEQMRFYQYVVYLTTLQKLDWKVIECCNESKEAKVFIFKRDDSIIDMNDELIRKAIIKAEWLKKLPVNDVL